MSTVGLTKAMRTELTRLVQGGKLYAGTLGGWLGGKGARTNLYCNMRQRGLLHERNVHGDPVTPRGHAALAAPRMTVGMLNVLIEVEAGSTIYSPMATSARRCMQRGWIDHVGEGEFDLTPAGRTALNNVRAALGSDLYREDLK